MSQWVLLSNLKFPRWVAWIVLFMFEFPFCIVGGLLSILLNYIFDNGVPAQEPTVPAWATLENYSFLLS